MDNAGPLCLACADLDHLVLLAVGRRRADPASHEASTMSAVVVRWSRTRKRYERQGLLVEDAALEPAEQQCLADEDARIAAGANGTASAAPSRTSNRRPP